MQYDSDIEAAVRRQLECDPHLRHAQVRVSVDHGVVTLTGAVTSLAQRAAAVAVARRVPGARDIANEVVARVPGELQSTDAEIAAAARRALSACVGMSARRLRITVSAGWVVLEGEVDRWCQREELERAVGCLSGVAGVCNRLAARTPPVTATAVRAAIAGVLARRAGRAAGCVRVVADGGVVTLRGPVQSRAERQALVAAVGHLPGVASVIDDLHPPRPD